MSDTYCLNVIDSDPSIQAGIFQGQVLKLRAELKNPIQYYLPIGKQEIALNPLLGKTIHLEFLGKIYCLGCNAAIKKSYQQGYCYPCTQNLARCDICIVRPEKCHYSRGTCREPEWAQTHCFIPHIVYLANTSGLKVGITRETQIPTRWIDQGATEALPILRVNDRHQSGLMEVMFKEHVNDKTNWRKMLQGISEPLDLFEERDQLFNKVDAFKSKVDDFKNVCSPNNVSNEIEVLIENNNYKLVYPVLEYPLKVNSLNIEKTSSITGTLLGIKGQYLILDTGVLNMRNLAGLEIAFSA